MFIKQKYIILISEITFLIFFIWFTYYGGFIIGNHFEEGWFVSEDGYNFIDSAKLFKEEGLSIFVKSELARQASLNYIVTIIIISILIDFNNWLYLFLTINLSLFFLSYFILKNFIKNITCKQDFFILNIILIFFYSINYENYFYVRLILSDCIFAFFTLLFFIKFNTKKNKFTNNFLIFIIFILIFFVNPKFIAVLFFIFFYYFIKTIIINNRFTNNEYFGVSIIFAYLLGLFLWAILYVNLNFIDYFKGDIFEEIKRFYIDGTIIYNRTSLDYFHDEITLFKIFLLGILRSISFFQFWSLNWDLKHNLVNLISISPLYLANILNIFYFNSYSEFNKKIIISIIAMVTAFSFMSSITAVDYDWRYRYPLYTILMIGLIVLIKEKNKLLRF